MKLIKQLDSETVFNNQCYCICLRLLRWLRSEEGGELAYFLLLKQLYGINLQLWEI